MKTSCLAPDGNSISPEIRPGRFDVEEGRDFCGKVTDTLDQTRLARHISSQFVRSAASPAANYEEACAAESVRDFVHKLSIVLKELRESRIWIRLIIKANLLKKERMADLKDESTQLCNIIGKSIVTAKQNLGIS